MNSSVLGFLMTFQDVICGSSCLKASRAGGSASKVVHSCSASA